MVHVPSGPDDFLYIRNYDPETWPAGDPPLFGDVDAHMLHYPCATKMYMLKNKDKEEVRSYLIWHLPNALPKSYMI